MANKKDKKRGELPKGIPTKRLLAAWLLENVEGISDVKIGKILDKVDFPGDSLARNPIARYRTLFNQGKLPPPISDPRTW